MPSPLPDLTPLARLTAIACAVAMLVLAATSPARADVIVDGTGEPAFTNSTGNTQWFHWQGSSSYEAYKVEFDYYANNALTTTESITVATNGSGTTWANWSGIASLVHGGIYGICGVGRYTVGGVSVRETTSCTTAAQTGKRAFTTIDRSKPAIAVSIDGGAAYSKTGLLSERIDYNDDLAYPFPANFVCRDAGTDSAQACSGMTFGYDAPCSDPDGGVNKVTWFECSDDRSATADGPFSVCVISADAAIPDNPNSSNQSQSAEKANLSTKTCDSIVIDRTAPSASVSASASSVTVGDLVSFDASASDATSGLSGAYAWAWGDGSAAASGVHATHTFTQAGTYEVALKVADAAGNESTATKTITVKDKPPVAMPDAGSGAGSGGTGAGSAGDGVAGASATPTATAPPSGGSTPNNGVKPALDVSAPKRVKSGTAKLAVALTASSAGRAQVALVRAGRVHATGVVTLAAAGTSAYKLKLPRKLKGGAYSLKVSFTTPAGAVAAKTVKLTVGAAKKARGARVSAHFSPRLTDAPVALPNGRPVRGRS